MRDLLHAQLVEVPENDDHSIELGQLTNRGTDSCAIFACYRLSVRRGSRVGDAARVLNLDPAPELAPALPDVRDRLVRCDPQDPVPHRTSGVAALKGPVC